MYWNEEIKAILFDLDDTLVNSKKAEYNAICEFKKLYSVFGEVKDNDIAQIWNNITMKNYEKYHKGEISFEELRTKRMKELFTNYSINISKEDAKNKFKDYQKIYEKVPAFRQEKADRLKHREDQAQSVGAWYLWMKIQERHKIPQDAGQSFNLSHSGKYVLCSAGVSGERVGCDIECMRKYHERLAEKYFCSSEYERIRNADEAERTEMFYRYWVLKESFLKATRKGLVMGLNTSEIQIPKQGDPFFLRQPEEIREAYYLKEYQTDGARIAVCSTNPNFDENILDMTDIYKREMIVELKD